MPIARIEERYRRGYEFQEYVKDLLGLSGYLEGQIYSTGIPHGIDYSASLKRTGKQRYTSPDILVLNKWAEDSPNVEFRFGIACSRRDTVWDNFGKKSFTVPTYQRYDLMKIENEKHLPIYHCFGYTQRDDFAIGITQVREPDARRENLTDESTGSRRSVDVYYLSNLMPWEEFLKVRVQAGDKEPDPSVFSRYKVNWVGKLQ